ncbi:MAG: hypothetical protein IPI84_15620 [Holophagaceae bacterium]|nr:hypothetical protein [Holophagaceae bacterium]
MATSDLAKANMERGMSIAQGGGRESGGPPAPPIQSKAPGMPMAMPPATDENHPGTLIALPLFWLSHP